MSLQGLYLLSAFHLSDAIGMVTIVMEVRPNHGQQCTPESELRSSPSELISSIGCADRCVERFDHHCPVICNCVGMGNCKSFFAFSVCMLVGQALWLRLATLFFYRAATHALSLPSASPLAFGAVFSTCLRTHTGKMLLTLIQVLPRSPLSPPTHPPLPPLPGGSSRHTHPKAN